MVTITSVKNTFIFAALVGFCLLSSGRLTIQSDVRILSGSYKFECLITTVCHFQAKSSCLYSTPNKSSNSTEANTKHTGKHTHTHRTTEQHTTNLMAE